MAVNSHRCNYTGHLSLVHQNTKVKRKCQCTQQGLVHERKGDIEVRWQRDEPPQNQHRGRSHAKEKHASELSWWHTGVRADMRMEMRQTYRTIGIGAAQRRVSRIKDRALHWRASTIQYPAQVDKPQVVTMLHKCCIFTRKKKE